MNTYRIVKWIAFISGILCLIGLLSGCVEYGESIVIHENGDATISAQFKGNNDDFIPAMALPTSGEWTITSYNKDSVYSGNGKFELEVQKTIPYGQPLPYSYATDSVSMALNLQFPTNIRVWSEGNRTFYEFTRTIKARTYLRYNYFFENDIDKDREKRILNNGIFNVSEDDREGYIQELKNAFSEIYYFQFSDALGIMVRQNDMTTAEMLALEISARHLLESYISHDRLLDILRQDDSGIEASRQKLIDDVHEELSKLVKENTDARKLNRFEAAFGGVLTAYKITGALDLQSMAIYIELPGTVISTNGLTAPGKPNEVLWGFEGVDLHDHDIPMYALSVVEH